MMLSSRLLVLAVCALLFCMKASASRKAWPVDGRRDESFESLPKVERDKILSLGTGFKEVRIEAADGINLQAIVFDPKPTKRNGKNPLIVFISSWGLNKWEYVVPAHKYAKKGYTVISYTARGFWGSGGQINLAGALDMADVSTVLDWAVANTNADSERIGLSGISYGAGMSLLASARDKRVKSVAAMSGWVDLAQSFLGNGESIRKEAARVLSGSAYLLGEVGDDLSLLFDDYFSNTDLDYLYSFVYNSSAANFIDQINTNKPAIFIANAFGDSLFTPDQFPAKFYNKLNVNKHLEFSPGDHAGPELLGIFGLPDQVWDRAGEWNDYYVRDAKTDSLTSYSPIILSSSYNSKNFESYTTWEEITNDWNVFDLTAGEQLISSNKKNLKERESTLSTIIAGENAGINGGIAFITSTVRSIVEKPLKFDLDKIDRQYAAVFQTAAFSNDVKIRGTTQINLNIVPKTSSNGTLVMYLLDVNTKKNEGRLITFAPWTFKNAVAGQTLNLPMEITMTAYDLEANNALAVVIQTHDPLFLDQSPAGAEISFLSGSTLSIPIHA
mmetsp:Transcript_26762/g.29172  ORF Transcript_26762/g.29172 Transcript_26762/m.29172 type:complete len:557 (+) Transcript_26762:55-1725(+)